MKDIILHQEDIDRFTTVLNNLANKARIALAVLIHKDGHLLSSAGTQEQVDMTAFAALVSANFSSTMAVANLIGEREFKTQFHVGKKRSIYISLVDQDTYLASVFVNEVSVDKVKVYTDEYSRELAEHLVLLYKGMEEADTFEVPLDETISMERTELVAQAGKDRPETKTEKQPGKPVLPRRLPHTGKTTSDEPIDERNLFSIDIPDDYYSRRIKKRRVKKRAKSP